MRYEVNTVIIGGVVGLLSSIGYAYLHPYCNVELMHGRDKLDVRPNGPVAGKLLAKACPHANGYPQAMLSSNCVVHPEGVLHLAKCHARATLKGA